MPVETIAPPYPTRCPRCGGHIDQRRPGGTSRRVLFLCDNCPWLRVAQLADVRAAGAYIERPPNCRKHGLPRTYTRANGRRGCFDCVAEERPED